MANLFVKLFFVLLSACSSRSTVVAASSSHHEDDSTCSSSLNGKNIVVTGATSGFGAAMASLFSREGANVFVGGRRADRGAQVAQDANATFKQVDVADADSNQAFFEAARKHFGGPRTIDAVFLNAGVEGTNEDTLATNLSLENFEYVYGVNVGGVVMGIKHGVPLLRQGGSIVVTSSVGSILPLGPNPIYASSKAAVDSLVKCYGAQFAEAIHDQHLHSLSIVGVNPTVYSTEMARRFAATDEAMAAYAGMVNPSRRAGTPEEFARVLLDYLLGKLPYTNGQSYVVDADAHFPLAEYYSRRRAAAARR